ncbi:MAG: GGDEF domain-containing protein [Cyclobacteriaceae bacterium]
MKTKNKASEWVKKNYTWFFSGLGVFILTLITSAIIAIVNNDSISIYWNEQIALTRLLGIVSILSILLISILFSIIWTRYKLRTLKTEVSSLIAKDTFIDDLVEIPNIKALDHKYLEAVNLAKDQPTYTPLTLMLLDIDNFKKFNDEYNYDTGNYILQQFIKLMKSNIRGVDDSIIRYQNGDEFLVIANKTTGRNGEKFAERLRKITEEENFKILDTEKIDSITISIGVTEVDLEDDSLQSCKKRLENALKTAKEKGKNRICLLNKET